MQDSTPPPDTEASEHWRERLARQRRNLPDEPGVYRYLDEAGHIIYVGKAKSLKKRVNSYFTKSQPDFKTYALVQHIRSIAYSVCTNELEALLLENNLIKELQPKYNIMLKDGKSYPYICIKNERFPRVFSTRRKIDDGSLYFGPYTSVGTLNTILHFFRNNFKLRTCKYPLTERNIQAGKFRPCLEYHIGKCKAPCVGWQEEAEYMEDIEQIKQILRGKHKALVASLKERMQQAAEALDFETANFLKVRIEQIQKLRRRSAVVSEQVEDVEVLTLAAEKKTAVVNHFKVVAGAIIQAHMFTVRRDNEESDTEILQTAASRLMAEDEEFSSRVLANLDWEDPESVRSYQVKVPQRGDELKLVKLSLKNCEVLLEEKVNTSRLNKKRKQEEDLLEQLKTELRMTTKPRHIECFDNSHIQGYQPTSSVVVFKNAKPARSDYRVFGAKDLGRPDDFAHMYEVVKRRYSRLQNEGASLPDLVVIDGGKGQLQAARKALEELQLHNRLTLISIAKRLEELYYVDDPVPLHLSKKSPVLYLLQRIRDEAHKAAINYHRKKRNKATLKTQLTDIPGIGPNLARQLLATFRSRKGVSTASREALTAVIGPARAEKVYTHFRQQAEQPETAQPAEQLDETRPFVDNKELSVEQSEGENTPGGPPGN